MTRWSLFILSIVLVPSWAFAGHASGLYRRVADLYNKAEVPTSKSLAAEQLWLGKCVDAYKPEDKYNGEILFHVERDPVVGDSFYMIPMLNTRECPVYTEEVERALRGLEKGHNKGVVTFASTEKAWKSYSESYGGIYLRQGKTLDGNTAFFMKARRNENEPTYCYFYIPITADGQSGLDPVVPPPADFVQ